MTLLTWLTAPGIYKSTKDFISWTRSQIHKTFNSSGHFKDHLCHSILLDCHEFLSYLLELLPSSYNNRNVWKLKESAAPAQTEQGCHNIISSFSYITLHNKPHERIECKLIADYIFFLIICKGNSEKYNNRISIY